MVTQCPECRSWLLCAADCFTAPWNDGKGMTTRFGFLLRQRRWSRMPVPRGDLGTGIAWTGRFVPTTTAELR